MRCCISVRGDRGAFDAVRTILICVCSPILEDDDNAGDSKGESKKEVDEHNENVADAVNTATAASGGGPVFVGNVEN